MPNAHTIKQELAALDQDGLRRRLSVMETTRPVFTSATGQRILNFSSNDYLDLTREPMVVDRAAAALREFGTGAGASRLLSGTTPLHEELEQRLARAKGKEACLVFGSGYLTNLGILGSFTDKQSVLIADKLIHACVLDGARFAGCKVQRFRHNDVDHLDSLLRRQDGANVLVAVESVYSMNGDCAPLESLMPLAKAHGARILVDEAHAVGVQGPHGSGRLRGLGLEDHADFSMGTLSKALAGYGGYVACDAPEREWLVNRARSLTYTTALPPASVGSALGALDWLEQHPDAGTKLLEKARMFRQRLSEGGADCGDSDTQIVAVQLGDPHRAVALSERLREEGVWVYPIRPPTVQPGKSCIRFSLSRAHTEEDVERAAKAVIRLCRE